MVCSLNCSAETKAEAKALERAMTYLSFHNFSYAGLCGQLYYDNFTIDECNYAADNCGADWYDQAVGTAKSYLELTTFTKEELKSKLEEALYWDAEAEYGASIAFGEKVGKGKIVNHSYTLLNQLGHEASLTKEQEKVDRITKMALAMAADEIDKKNQKQEKSIETNVTAGERNALSAAKLYLSIVPLSYSGIIKQLEFEGYTKSEAQYGAENCGADWKEQAVKSAKNYLSIMPMSRKALKDQLIYDGYTESEAEYGVASAYK